MNKSLVGFADDLMRLFPILDGYAGSAQQVVTESDISLETNRTSGRWMRSVDKRGIVPAHTRTGADRNMKNVYLPLAKYMAGYDTFGARCTWTRSNNDEVAQRIRETKAAFLFHGSIFGQWMCSRPLDAQPN